MLIHCVYQLVVDRHYSLSVPQALPVKELGSRFPVHQDCTIESDHAQNCQLFQAVMLGKRKKERERRKCSGKGKKTEEWKLENNFGNLKNDKIVYASH